MKDCLIPLIIFTVVLEVSLIPTFIVPILHLITIPLFLLGIIVLIVLIVLGIVAATSRNETK
jgi:hypothetical protein